ncbi:MAG: hypothetical protein AAB214_22185, partial [Fibrobacterota bacterium]
MRNWSWSSVEALSPSPSDVFVVLGLEGAPSGLLSGATYAVLNHRMKASLEAQAAGEIKGADWVDADELRA